MSISGEEDEQMWRLTTILARSGGYHGWLEIEEELLARGFPRARKLLDQKPVRDRLDRQCAEARSAKARLSERPRPAGRRH